MKCLLLSLLLLIGIVNCKNKKTDCTVDSSNNTISGKSLCGDLIIETDNEYLTISQNQYASTSFPENISPTMIFIADSSQSCNNDISLILKYAQNCGYSIVIKSGGHQFSGLSSCTDQCIQIDLSQYNDTKFINSSKFNQYENVIQAGVGTDLQQLLQFLDENDLFIPTGATNTIGIGGHFQTGGIGYLLRSHGAFTDYVIGFDIILSDGTSKLITSDNNYKNLFYSVRGGGPGSFGIVTNLYLKTENNNDYPNDAIGVQAIWLYTDQDARQIAKQWLILQNDLNYTQYDDFFPLFAIAPLFDGAGTQIILIAFIWINDVNGRSYNDFGKNYFMQPFIDCAVNSPIIFSEIPGTVSNLMNLFLNPSPNISPIPYILRANGVKNSWNEEFIDILIDNVTSIINYSNNNNQSILVNLLFETYGGKFLSNDPDKILSALPFRDLNMLLAIQLYYKTNNGKIYSNQYLNEIFENYISSYWNNEDIRVFGYTFGDLDMKIEKENLNYYIDNNVFNTIKEIKKDVDECNIFKNTFTVPLPNDDIIENEFKEMDIYDLDSKDILMIKQWTNKFYYELDLFTSTSSSGNNGDCANLEKFIESSAIPDVRLTATGDLAGIWNSRTEAIGLFCSLFGPYINEDHFQSGITFLSYLKRKKNDKCKFNADKIVKIASKTFIYSIVTFEGNVRATFINRNEFTFIQYQNNNNWLLSEWVVDIERVDVANLG